MKTYCPNCGSENDGAPGGRVTCHACTASFDAPDTPPSAEAPPAATSPAQRPVRSALPATPLQGAGPDRSQGTRPIAPPRPQAPNANPLAIISFVLGLACCIPFSGVGAIITGVIARSQIAESQGRQGGAELALAGIIIGSVSVVMSLWFGIAKVLGGN